MKNTVSKIIITLIILFISTEISASPQISPTATKIMREVKLQYKTEKAQMYLSVFLSDRNLTEDEIFKIRERMNYFFDSDAFLETGAAYLTALFIENDLSEILSAIENGNFFDKQAGRNRYEGNAALARKMQRLFERLDPYLYRYLEQNIIPQPKVSE